MESLDGSLVEHTVEDLGYFDSEIVEVTLVSEDSHHSCDVNQEQWGFTPTSIWVDKGCIANFRVCVEGIGKYRK